MVKHHIQLCRIYWYRYLTFLEIDLFRVQWHHLKYRVQHTRRTDDRYLTQSDSNGIWYMNHGMHGWINMQDTIHNTEGLKLLQFCKDQEEAHFYNMANKNQVSLLCLKTHIIDNNPEDNSSD